MKMEDIKSHWVELAKTKGDTIGATTRTETIKKLEIDAFCRWIKKKDNNWTEILEIGCGNGTNCIDLGKQFKTIHFYGVDYVEEMVTKARERAFGLSNVSFDVDDVTALRSDIVIGKKFDAIITDRCLINLNTIDLQKAALRNIFEHIKNGGYYFMIENSIQSYSKQNDLRTHVGLDRRFPAKFNLFLDDDTILEYLKKDLSVSLEIIDNFASLHDLMLYVIEPLSNLGNTSYGSEAINLITNFLLKCGDNGINKFGEYGQNRLYVLRKDAKNE